MRKFNKIMSFLIMAGLVAGALTGGLICMISLSAGMPSETRYVGFMILGATALVAYPAMKLLIYFDQEEKKEMEEKAYEAEHAV